MVDTQIFTSKQAYQQIENLISEKKLAEAHRACLEFLRFDPENLQVIRFKNKIEKLVKEYNRKIIKEDLKELKPLWQEENYEELLKKLKKLLIYIDDYPELKEIIMKAEKGYHKSLLVQQKKYYQQEFQNIQSLITQKKFPEALRNAEKLRILDIHNEEIKKMIQNLRNDWIRSEIDSNQSLLHSEKFEDILLFLQQLTKIDQNSSWLESLINITKKNYEKFKISEKKEFIYQGLEQVRTLYQLKKYEKALSAVQEILALDPNHKQAGILFKKAQRKVRNQINKEVIVQMLSAQKHLELEYKDNPNAIKNI